GDPHLDGRLVGQRPAHRAARPRAVPACRVRRPVHRDRRVPRGAAAVGSAGCRHRDLGRGGLRDGPVVLDAVARRAARGAASRAGRSDRRPPALRRPRRGARDRHRRGADRVRVAGRQLGLGGPCGNVRRRRRRRPGRPRPHDSARGAHGGGPAAGRSRDRRDLSERMPASGPRASLGPARPCGRLAARPPHRNPTGRLPSWRNPRPMSAEELRAKIREIPDFPKPGILFYDITTLLKDRAAYKEAIDLMIEPYKGEKIDIVVGMESRGFIFSSAMAYQLGAGLVPVRKLGKLPAETITVEYALEYGSNTLEIHRDAIESGQKVLIVDDLLATGGTVKGTIELIERLKGDVVGLAFLVELDFLKGRDRLDGRRVTSVIQY